MGGEPVVDADWVLAALDQSSDLVVVIAADATVKWVSQAVRRLGGYEPSNLVGRSIADFVHPDDLARAIEVVELASADTFDHDTPMTPALYRMLHSDGTWVPLEINATRAASGDGDLLLVVRQAGDLVLNDHLLEVITGGGSFEAQLDVVLELGWWRYPTDGYAVICAQGDGTRLIRSRSIADDRLSGKAPADGPTPWDVASATGEPVVLRDLDDPTGVSPELAAAAMREGFDSVLAVPVPDPAHEAPACLIVWSTPGGPSVAGQRYPVSNMQRALSLSLQWRNHLHKLERAANVDELTGLATRQRFFELAPGWLERGASVVLYVDLDHFKQVNDRCGHSAGDYVLATTATRMADALGPDVLLGRLGGDEFAVLCPPGSTLEDAEQAAAAIVEAAREPIDLKDGTVAIGASVGIAVRAGGETLDAMLERADQGLLATKATGKGGWQVDT